MDIRRESADNLKSALVKGMVEFSKASNIKLIAEGVETYEELETIINLGVQYAQGYYIQNTDADIHDISNSVLQAIYEINTSMNQKARNNLFHSPIKYLCDMTEIVSPDESVLYAYDTIKQDKNCFGLCVIGNDKPLGIITKEKLALTLSGQYGFALYGNKNVSAIMDQDFLSVDSDTPVNIVSNLAMNRPNDNLYDFIVVTEDDKYLGTVTIKNLLQKSSEIEVSAAKQQNPLTGLPGNLVIEQKLNECIRDKSEYSVSYFDIDHFKAYNDVYGFENGDLVIKLLADILRQLISDGQFIGHVGGDDFVAIFDSHKASDDLNDIIQKFESDVLALYNPADIQNRYIAAKNRYGTIEKFPMMTLTAAVVNNESCVYTSAFELSEELAALKNRIKQFKHFCQLEERQDII